MLCGELTFMIHLLLTAKSGIMNKKTIGILSAALLIAGGLILQNLYKRKKLKGLENGLEPLKKGTKKMRKILEQAHVPGTSAHN